MPEQKLYIGNLPYRATEGDIRKHLGGYGPVYSVILIYDDETCLSRGYGFVRLEDYAAEAIMRDLHNSFFMGRRLVIRRAIEQDAAQGDAGGAGQHPQRKYAGTDADMGGGFAKYGDFSRKDFKGLRINGKYYKIKRNTYGLYHAYKYTDNDMKYSGPSNANPIDAE